LGELFSRFEMRSLIHRMWFARNVRHCIFFLAPATLGVACVATIFFHQDAIAQMEKNKTFAGLKNRVIAALENPFAILDERSPGGRGSSPQHLTKTAGGPHERVLAETREHEPPPDASPSVDAPKAAGGGPGAATGPDGLAGMPFSSGNAPNPFSPFDAASGIPNAFLPFANNAASGPGNPATLPDSPPSSLPPIGIGDPGFPPPSTITDIPPPVTTDPPGAPPTTGGGTPTIPVPEPASLGLMLFGVLTVAALRHSQKRRSVT
jgi:hypothetical protein